MKSLLRTPAGALAGCLLAINLIACQSSIPNRIPVGEIFPTAQGETLEERQLRLPADLKGKPAVLLVGYAQDAQFDADRWLYGLLQADLQVQLYELPTIPGLFPRAISGTIDSGMRSGIPREDWAVVATLYGSDAERVAEFTGTQKPRNIRVLLLDEAGRVRWFHDRGFSASKLIELEQSLQDR